MVTLYGVLLFLHILGAGIWLGGEAISFGLRALAPRSGDHARAVALTRDTDRLDKIVVSPAVAVLLGAGFWLVLEGHWGFDRFFVILGLAGFAVVARGRRDHRPERKGPPEGPRGTRRGFAPVRPTDEADQLGLLGDVVILTAIVFVMATKPTV